VPCSITIDVESLKCPTYRPRIYRHYQLSNLSQLGLSDVVARAGSASAQATAYDSRVRAARPRIARASQMPLVKTIPLHITYTVSSKLLSQWSAPGKLRGYESGNFDSALMHAQQPQKSCTTLADRSFPITVVTVGVPVSYVAPYARLLSIGSVSSVILSTSPHIVVLAR